MNAHGDRVREETYVGIRVDIRRHARARSRSMDGMRSTFVGRCDRSRRARLFDASPLVVRREFFFRHSLGVGVGVCLVFAPAVPAFVSSRRVPHAGQRRRCVRRGRVREQKRRFVSHASFRVPVCPSPDVPFGVPPPRRRRRRRSERRERRVFDRIARFPRVIRVCRVHARVPQSMKRHRARVAQRRRGGERASRGAAGGHTVRTDECSWSDAAAE